MPGSLFKPRHSPSTTCCAEMLLSLSSCTSFRQLWPPETFREDFRKSLLPTFLAVMGNKVYSISRRFQRLLDVHLPVQGKSEQEFPVNTSRYPLTYLLLPKSSGSPGNLLSHPFPNCVPKPAVFCILKVYSNIDYSTAHYILLSWLLGSSSL